MYKRSGYSLNIGEGCLYHFHNLGILEAFCGGHVLIPLMERL